MGRGGRRARSAEHLNTEERLKRAKQRADNLVDHVSSLLLMHEANAIVIYSPTLRQQIPRSRAAWAFNQFQTSMHQFELLRLLAVWDSYGEDRESIPTILELVNHPDVERTIVAEAGGFYRGHDPHDLSPSDDPEVEELKAEWLRGWREETAAEEERKAKRRLQYARLKAQRIQRWRGLPALRRFRNQYLAHNLTLSEEDLDPAMKGRRPKYGDERFLLEQTVKIADALHLTLNGTSFDWDGARENARDRARELWSGCQFTIP
jgi:hypothetical protein